MTLTAINDQSTAAISTKRKTANCGSLSEIRSGFFDQAAGVQLPAKMAKSAPPVRQISGHAL